MFLIGGLYKFAMVTLNMTPEANYRLTAMQVLRSIRVYKEQVSSHYESYSGLYIDLCYRGSNLL